MSQPSYSWPEIGSRRFTAIQIPLSVRSGAFRLKSSSIYYDRSWCGKHESQRSLPLLQPCSLPAQSFDTSSFSMAGPKGLWKNTLTRLEPMSLGILIAVAFRLRVFQHLSTAARTVALITGTACWLLVAVFSDLNFSRVGTMIGYTAIAVGAAAIFLWHRSGCSLALNSISLLSRAAAKPLPCHFNIGMTLGNAHPKCRRDVAPIYPSPGATCASLGTNLAAREIRWNIFGSSAASTRLRCNVLTRLSSSIFHGHYYERLSTLGVDIGVAIAWHGERAVGGAIFMAGPSFAHYHLSAATIPAMRASLPRYSL